MVDNRSLIWKARRQEWKEAKTYAQTYPHEYIVKEWNEELFEGICAEIAARGKDRAWIDGTVYRYLIIGSYKYWRIGKILNRERMVHRKGYSIPAWLLERITTKYRRCIYCDSPLKPHLNKRGTPSDKATVEHMDYESVDDPQEDNVAMCCGSCNSSRGAMTLTEWFAYCKESRKEVDVETASKLQVVKACLERERKTG